MSELKDDVNQALKVVQDGGVILYPTDTIWGIGCDATNAEAVSRVYKIKNREDSKSLIVLLHNEGLLNSYVEEVPEIAWELIEVSNKPLTIIYPGAKNLAHNLLAENGSIGIRIVREEFCEALLSRFRKPLVSTSANISGDPSPANFDEVSPGILAQVDYVVNWKQDDLSKSVASSIIQLGLGGEIKVLR